MEIISHCLTMKSPYYPQNHRWISGRNKKSYRNYLTRLKERVKLLRQQQKHTTNGESMKLYKNRNNKRDISCGYCLNDGHNKRNCPTMKKHWELNKHLTRNELHSCNLTGVDITMFPSAYANYYGDSQAEQQFRAHFRYMKDRYEPKTSTKKKKRSKPKCGFCGSTAHTRRNCNKMKKRHMDLMCFMPTLPLLEQSILMAI